MFNTLIVLRAWHVLVQISWFSLAFYITCFGALYKLLGYSRLWCVNQLGLPRVV